MKDLIDRIKYFMEDHKITLPKIMGVITILGAGLVALGTCLAVRSTEYFEICTPMLTVGVILLVIAFYGWFAIVARKYEPKPEPEPQTEFIAAPARPALRFNFPEELVRSELQKIADEMVYSLTIESQRFEILPFGDDRSTKMGYMAVFEDDEVRFTVYIRQDAIEIIPENDFDLSFIIFDDFLRLNSIRVAEKYKIARFDEMGFYVWEGDANPMSDSEIFQLIACIMKALDGITDFSAESSPLDVYRKHYEPRSYTFNLTKPNSADINISIANFNFHIN